MSNIHVDTKKKRSDTRGIKNWVEAHKTQVIALGTATIAIGTLAGAKIGSSNLTDPKSFLSFYLAGDKLSNSKAYVEALLEAKKKQHLKPFSYDLPVNFPESTTYGFRSEVELEHAMNRVATAVTTHVPDLRDEGKRNGVADPTQNTEAAGALILGEAFKEIDKLRAEGIEIPKGNYDRAKLDASIKLALSGGEPIVISL